MLIILGILFVLFVVLFNLRIFSFIKSKKIGVYFYVKPEKDVDLVYSNDLSGCRITVEINGVWFFSDLYLNERDALEDCRQLNKILKRGI